MTEQREHDRWVAELLETSARELTYPETPHMGDVVAARIGGDDIRPAAKPWLRVAGLAAVVAIAILLAALTVRDVREAVAEFLGLAVAGEEIRIAPTPAAGMIATPLPAPVPIEDTAASSTLSAAAASAGFSPRLPAGEAPLSVYLARTEGFRAIVLQYEAFDVWEAPLDNPGFISKLIGPATSFSEVNVQGTRGYWLSGGRRVVRFVDANGQIVAGTIRTVDRNTLVWSVGGVYFRLETTLERDQAVTIANTIR